MRGIKMLVILIVPIILISFIIFQNTSDVIKCNIDTNNYVSQLKVKFENDKPVKYKFKDKMFFSFDAPESEIYYHSKYSEYGYLIAEDYASIRNNRTNVTIHINYNFEKDNSVQENKLIIKRTDTKKSALEKIENFGYKCK